MNRSTRQLVWQGVLLGMLLIIGSFTLVWAGNVSTNIEDTGTNVGIGTTTPQNKLDVNGGVLVSPNTAGKETFELSTHAANEGRLRIKNVNTLTVQIRAGGDSYFNGGNVGIGTTSPGAALDVVRRIRLSGATGSGKSLSFIDTAAVRYGWQIGQNEIIDDSLTITPSTVAGGSTFTTPAMTIKNDGTVGIGTTSPAAKLHVAGDVQVDGNLAAKYQDVAEWVKASSSLPPGTVVVVDPQGRNQILPASQSYDTRVAGVVSDRPGLLLGEAGEGKVKVAQSGRVKVKVDAAYGPIAAGDLLVTSPSPGHAMRSSPVKLGETVIHRPGTLLGKALEPLEEGQGEILVLLTLQ